MLACAGSRGRLGLRTRASVRVSRIRVRRLTRPGSASDSAPGPSAAAAPGPCSAGPVARRAQTQQPGAVLWSTIPTLATQVGGPAPAVVVPNPAEAARAALFMSQLAAMQAATLAAALPQLTTPPPAYVAPARQPRSTSQAAAALNRNEIWIPYSPSTLGSHSQYPHIRPPEMCFECNAPHSHAGNKCLARFARIFGAPLPGWVRDGKKNAAAWTIATALPCYSSRGRR